LPQVHSLQIFQSSTRQDLELNHVVEKNFYELLADAERHVNAEERVRSMRTTHEETAHEELIGVDVT
jgi:hypothetical protein